MADYLGCRLQMLRRPLSYPSANQATPRASAWSSATLLTIALVGCALLAGGCSRESRELADDTSRFVGNAPDEAAKLAVDIKRYAVSNSLLVPEARVDVELFALGIIVLRLAVRLFRYGSIEYSKKVSLRTVFARQR